MTAMATFRDGLVPFKAPSIGGAIACETYYKIVGSLTNGKRPLIILHGGPGSTHNYTLPLVSLHTTYGIPVVFYDQLGSGRSTHLKEKMGDSTFWTEELFMDELDNLIRALGLGEFDVLGHSWGGMLAMRWAARRPAGGLRRLVVSDSPASMPMFVEGAMKLRKNLPEAVQNALDKHEAAGTTDSAEYHAAEEAFYAQHLCRVSPMPEGLLASFQAMSADPTVYHTMNGPSEFFITGSLKTWSIVDDLDKIHVPVLVLNGRFDEVQDSAVQPLVAGIKDVRWVRFEESSHMPFVEEEARYGAEVASFLG